MIIFSSLGQFGDRPLSKPDMKLMHMTSRAEVLPDSTKNHNVCQSDLRPPYLCVNQITKFNNVHKPPECQVGFFTWLPLLCPVIRSEGSAEWYRKLTIIMMLLYQKSLNHCVLGKNHANNLKDLLEQKKSVLTWTLIKLCAIKKVGTPIS